MSCYTDKFIINTGLTNEFTITIKQTGTTLPMEIEATDTFKVYLFNLATNTQILSTEDDPVTISVDSTIDTISGKIKITFNTAGVDLLTGSRGPKEDKYYLQPTYRLVIDCDTANNGKFIAKIPNVYVE